MCTSLALLEQALSRPGSRGGQCCIHRGDAIPQETTHSAKGIGNNIEELSTDIFPARLPGQVELRLQSKPRRCAVTACSDSCMEAVCDACHFASQVGQKH